MPLSLFPPPFCGGLCHFLAHFHSPGFLMSGWTLSLNEELCNFFSKVLFSDPGR